MVLGKSAAIFADARIFLAAISDPLFFLSRWRLVTPITNYAASNGRRFRWKKRSVGPVQRASRKFTNAGFTALIQEAEQQQQFRLAVRWQFWKFSKNWKSPEWSAGTLTKPIVHIYPSWATPPYSTIFRKLSLFTNMPGMVILMWKQISINAFPHNFFIFEMK